jgi:hypothetical protein
VLRTGPGEPLPSLSFRGAAAPRRAAALVLLSGADIVVGSKLSGHVSIAVTCDVHGHLVGTIASDVVNGAPNLIAHTGHSPEAIKAAVGAGSWRPTGS